MGVTSALNIQWVSGLPDIRSLTSRAGIIPLQCTCTPCMYSKDAFPAYMYMYLKTVCHCFVQGINLPV